MSKYFTFKGKTRDFYTYWILSSDFPHDPHIIVDNQTKVLQLIQAWGEFGKDLNYLLVFKKTYKAHYNSGGMDFVDGTK